MAGGCFREMKKKKKVSYGWALGQYRAQLSSEHRMKCSLPEPRAVQGWGCACQQGDQALMLILRFLRVKKISGKVMIAADTVQVLSKSL